MKSINGSKFSTIPSTLSIDCTYAAKARLTNMSVLLVTNTPSSRIMSISGCYTCIWTNVEHFMRSTKCYQGIYVVDTRQLLCKAWTHISRLCMTGLSSCQEKAFPSKKKKKNTPSLWRCFHLHKGNVKFKPQNPLHGIWQRLNPELTSPYSTGYTVCVSFP